MLFQKLAQHKDSIYNHHFSSMKEEKMMLLFRSHLEYEVVLGTFYFNGIVNRYILTLILHLQITMLKGSL